MSEQIETTEINRTIHEALGNRPQHDFAQFSERCYWCRCVYTPANAASRCVWANRPFPDYCSDLNAMAEVERAIDARDKLHAYAVNIRLALFGEKEWLTLADEGKYITASAETRARAAYEVLKGESK